MARMPEKAGHRGMPVDPNRGRVDEAERAPGVTTGSIGKLHHFLEPFSTYLTPSRPTRRGGRHGTALALPRIDVDIVDEGFIMPT